ncbi:MAG: aminotransferase class V-fold PLP-dependent enzyme [Clostridia bacterium]
MQEARRLMFQRLRESLPALRDRVYLNTGTSGPVPEPAFARQVALLETFLREGFSSPPAMAAYAKALREARAAVASVLSCDPERVALTQSTSDGLGLVASGLDWRPGDEVITSDLEHVSGIAPWRELARRKGVVVKELASEDGYLEASRVLDAVTPRTRLICISHVSYATGAVLPVREVCLGARDAGVLVAVDGAQAAGHLPVDVKELGCHFYALPGQKWLLGPEGTGALYVAPEALDVLAPSRVGWASLSSEGDGLNLIQLHRDARRFETGTVDAPAFAALAESIRILESLGWEAIFTRARALARRAAQGLAALPGVRILTPRHADSGLLTFAVEGLDPERVVKELWEKRRIVIRSIPKPRALRASFHAFNNEGDVEALVAAVDQMIRKA